MKALAVISALVIASTLLAAELHDVKFQDQIKIGDTSLVLNGLGVRKAFSVIKVYIAGLYLEKKSTDPKAILDSSSVKHLELHFKRYVARKKLQEAWKASFKTNKESGYNYSSDLSKLNSAMSNMKADDKMKLTFFSDKTEVRVKDRDVVTIQGSKFGRLMLKVFLGTPPNPELKAGLLGQ